MQHFHKMQCRWPLIWLLLLCTALPATAQNILSRTVSVNAVRQPLGTVLNDIGTKGKFVFSYNSNFLPADSLITLQANNKTVKQLLDLIFQGSLSYKESGNYLILQHPPPGPVYTVSGYVVDQQTGKKLSNVSVYEKDQLVSTLTNDQGYFRLRLRVRDKIPLALINISKELYLDTAIVASPAMVQDFTVSIRPAAMITLKPVEVTQQVEKTWLGRFMLSSRARMQSVNLKFLMDKPYQYSIVPGLGTHGHMSAQVVNRFSFNLIGGYSAGLNGVEIAGVFNIDKGNVQDVQVAGLFNVVGGHVKGLQLAGIYNQALDTVQGVQIGGIANVVKDEASGVQIGGIASVVQGHFKGVQLNGIGGFDRKSFSGVSASGIVNLTLRYANGLQMAGIMNIVKDSTRGMQLAGIGNQTRTRLQGVQMAAVFNYARRLQGLQVGLVNVADTSEGLSLGIVNYIHKGYHKLSVYATELMPLNVAFQSGTRGFYTVVSAGIDRGASKAFSTGFGIGHVFGINGQLDLPCQLSCETFYLGSRQTTAALCRLEPSLQWQLSRKFGVFAGPSYSVCYSPQQGAEGFKSLPVRYATSYRDKVSGWFGFHAGICIF
ncbi:MAG TPA: STN and carboxypeptidase regulatory-like domain-containing protein [Chitinophaga sp.]